MKESKEAIVGIIKLYKEVALLAKDGLQPKDGLDLIVAIATHASLRDALLEAVKGSSEIPSEWSELKFGEIAELVEIVIDEMKKG